MEDVNETVGETAFRRIRQEIIAGTLPPGSRIRLEHAKQRYGASVSTLRETLSRLAAENFVVAEGQRGFQVAPASERELLELADLRALLENHAIGLSFQAGNLDWEAGIVAAHHKLSTVEQHILAGEESRTADWIRYDWEFHQALVSACNSATLMSTLSSVFDRFLRYHLLARSFRGQPVVDDHRRLFELAMKRDTKGAREIVSRHVLDGTQHVLNSGCIR